MTRPWKDMVQAAPGACLPLHGGRFTAPRSRRHVFIWKKLCGAVLWGDSIKHLSPWVLFSLSGCHRVFSTSPLLLTTALTTDIANKPLSQPLVPPGQLTLNTYALKYHPKHCEVSIGPQPMCQPNNVNVLSLIHVYQHQYLFYRFCEYTLKMQSLQTTSCVAFSAARGGFV